MTINDIAKKAGVSKTTVSFAFNNPERISTATYERIMSIVHDEGYSPNPVARILSSKKTKTIGLVLPQTISVFFQNIYLAELLRGIGSVCDKEEFTVSILSPFKGIITQTILNAAVDGIIIMGISSKSEVHATLKKRKMPYVTIDSADISNQSDYINIGIEEEKLAENLMDILVENGHRKILFCSLQPISPNLQNKDDSSTLELRISGIQKSIQKNNLEQDKSTQFQFIDIPATLSDSYEIAKKILRKKTERPTAIYCMGDIQAYGFYRAAKELLLNIPEDLSIVSFDDLPITQILSPGLTTVHQSGYEKGRIATKELFNLITNQTAKSQKVEAYIAKRESVKTIK